MLNNIDLSGNWSFEMDSLDKGVEEAWFNRKLVDKIKLPGSMTTNGKGNDITVDTKWTGNFWNSAWFKDTAYAKYREPGNIKVSFWLQPVKYYVGAAWYQKKVNIPSGWKEKHIELFLERCHWETTLWIDGHKAGMQNALGAPHIYPLDNLLTPGNHIITLRIDNRVKEINPGMDAHSITDNTQTNWNGVVGKMMLISRPAVYFSDVQLFSDIDKKNLHIKLVIHNITGKETNQQLKFSVSNSNLSPSLTLLPVSKNINLKNDSTIIEINYPMGSNLYLWDEFHPNLYSLNISLTGAGGTDSGKMSFGMRKFIPDKKQLTINGRPVFLRGTLECAIFPKTGFPATDIDAWLRIFRICRSYGLNHIRFHSWCPPEAAFAAADRLGFYLSIECSAWATVGDGKAIDQFIYDESNRIVRNFGNHPSFCMMAYGNEPGGDHLVEFLTGFVKYWKAKDNRRLYTTASGWPIVAENDYNVTPDPRIQHWGEGLMSIINAKLPNTNYDWADTISKWSQPSVSHEIGQWCVYPDFKEMAGYTGVLKPKNFEIFRDKLTEHGMANLADSFLFASGKLQVLCYKADIEAALRTKNFGGFQLLDLHDFPGQGTALIGVVNPFWNDKGYVTGKEYRHFCNSTVPLVRLSKMIYTNNEELNVPVEIAHFGEKSLKDAIPLWNIKDISGRILFHGKLSKIDIPVGNGFKLGEIRQSLVSIKKPMKLILTVSLNNFQNSWDIFVYPDSLPPLKEEVYITQQLDDNALGILKKGGKVLLTVKQGSIKAEMGGNIAVGFSSIFWNTAWTDNQPPHTLGILCNPKHPALQAFPTEYYSNWQWRDGMSHCNVIRLDAISPTIKPIVRVIDDWFTARPLALIFECKVAKGKLLISGIDLVSDQEKRPEAKQLLYSLKKYMVGSEFNPVADISIENIMAVFK
ncbi:MAG TPA: glycoside hydrolase family 2 TIM barrel-domain containing protein [Puia sp.]|nr:glycoside hydrolase family 2 TIM barrel-domain containing protein [Puia sp.]